MRIGRFLISVGVAAGLALIGAIIYGYAAKPGWVGVADKTLWDWLNLLIIPFVIAVGGTVGGYYFTRSENRVAQAIADRRAQDEALQAYLDQIGELLLDKERSLRDSKEGDEVRTLARARTLTAVKRLDAEHNRSLLHFLRDSQLVGAPENPIIDFRNADLSGANLSRSNLRGANLGAADLSHADLSTDLCIEA